MVNKKKVVRPSVRKHHPQTTFKKLTLLSHIECECTYIQFMMIQLRACNLFWVQSYCKIMIPATTFFASVDTP